MKSGGRGAEPPVEAELSAQRPKRKCLQWHPLLSKKTLDFSEDEEEDDEEELEKPPPFCGKARSQEPEGGAATEEEEDDGEEEEEEEEDSSEQRARRPMNAFLLFCKRHRSLVRQERPRLDNRGATKILADWWAVLEPTEKQKYTDMAKEYKDAFMKANPGYKWCPPSNKSAKTPPPSAGGRKKAWPFSSEPPKDCAPSKKQPAKAESVPQIHFSMADPTEMGGLSMLLLAGEHALTAREISSKKSPVAADSTKQTGPSDSGPVAQVFSGTPQPTRADSVTEGGASPAGLSEACPPQSCSGTLRPEGTDPKKTSANPAAFRPPEVSSGSQVAVAEGRQCGQSALFQLAEMCLASEAKKPATSAPRPGVPSPAAPSAAVATETVAMEPAGDARGAPLPSPPISSSSRSVSASSTPTDDTPPALGQPLTAKKKKKKKKKKRREEGGALEGGGASKGAVGSACAPAKPCKRSPSSESDLESLIDTIDAVAKGSWGPDDEGEEVPRKRPRPPSDPAFPKRKSRPKVKKPVKARETEEEEDEEEDCKPVEAFALAACPETDREGDVASVKAEPSANAEESLAPPSPSATPMKSEDKAEAKLESCGSRKSERACKGALYKTLVSEGMLTSLRANVDRGRRGSGRGSATDPEGSLSEESWTFAQSGPGNSKKPKKSKSKDEPAPGLGKLEEEFEKKFNSLPQYSPLTFDRKGTCVAKKKKICRPGAEDAARPIRGSSPTQKKNLFHKIVSKYKHRKEQPTTMDKAIAAQAPTATHAGQTAKHAGSCPALYAEGPGGAETLVGSQKRKARKRKITHLVRTADGRLSPAEGDRAGEPQDQKEKPSAQRTLCNHEQSGAQEARSASAASAERPGASGLPAFFSLAALAEVAAMENAQRTQHAAGLPREGQSKEMAQTHVLISCGDQ